MTQDPSTIVAWGARIAFLLLAVSLVLAVLRLLRGPSDPDRVVALDLVATLSIGFIAVATIATDEIVLVRVAIVFALLAFLGTLAYARFIARSREP